MNLFQILDDIETQKQKFCIKCGSMMEISKQEQIRAFVPPWAAKKLKFEKNTIFQGCKLIK